MRTAWTFLLAAAALVCTSGNAQVTAVTFYETITDSTGASVPGAVTMVHDDTGTTASKLSDAAGEFGFDFLRVGAYTLRIEKIGFEKFEGKNIDLAAG